MTAKPGPSHEPILHHPSYRHVFLHASQACPQELRNPPQHSLASEDRDQDPHLRPSPSRQGIDRALGHGQLFAALGRCHWRQRVCLRGPRSARRQWSLLHKAWTRAPGRHLPPSPPPRLFLPPSARTRRYYTRGNACLLCQLGSITPGLRLTDSQASQEFMGTSYNLLTKNCNHFTSYLCQQLTGRSAPSWLNRAASIGVALPCVVPREWIAPPDHDTADGELLDEDFEDERSSMLRHDQRRQRLQAEEDDTQSWETGVEDRLSGASSRSEQRGIGGHPRLSAQAYAPRIVKDTEHREIPAAERAPLPKRLT